MIYLDNAATTLPDADSLEKASVYLKEKFFNPSAMYREGFELHKEIAAAKTHLLSFITPSSDYDLIFTSSGTEADNQALFNGIKRGNLVVNEGEHAAVYMTAKELKKRGHDVRFAKLLSDGRVDVEHLLSLIDQDTSLVSVMHVNNETGAVNDIEDIADSVKKLAPKAVFHSDGVQAFGKIVYRLSPKIDLYTISAHKIGGVRGVAGLIKRKDFHIDPYIFGGGQENGLRSGTENTFAIKQFEFAAEKRFRTLEADFLKIQEFNRYMREQLNPALFSFVSSKSASPYILCAAIRGIRAEVLLHILNDKGLLIGTGSACSSRNRYSRVILACGIKKELAEGIIRLSFSAHTTKEEIDQAVQILNESVSQLAERMK